MKAEVLNLGIGQAGPTVRISHKDGEIIWSVSSFGKNSFEKFDVFEQLNQFWAGLTEKEQDHVFQIYQDMKYFLDNVWEKNALTAHLQKKAAELLDFHDPVRMHDWLIFKSSVILPNTFDREYVESVDKQGSREQTYIQEDYTKLVVLALIVRTMIPVWGEFISRNRQEMGNQFKEYYAFQLISGSKIYRSDAMEKLRSYIDHGIGDDSNRRQFVLTGISSEDFPAWILGLVLIRRVSIGDIRGVEQNANLVTYIYMYIKQKVRSGGGIGPNVIKEKRMDISGTDPENRLSSLERYKYKYEISIGETVELEYAVKNLREIAFKLSSNMTEELFQSAMRTSQQLSDKHILDPQMTILRWVFKPIVSSKAPLYISKESVVGCLGVCQAVLWARGHHFLSLLSTAYANLNDDEMMISGVDSRTRIPKEIVDELNIYYPYSRGSGRKAKQVKQTNPAIAAIDSLAEQLSMAIWTTTAERQFMEACLGSVHSKRLPIPSDIRVLISKLVLQLAKRDWV